MDSMKASLRLMRSSRSISYWDLGAAGMFDGMLVAVGVFCLCSVFPPVTRVSFACALDAVFSLRAGSVRGFEALCAVARRRAAMAACVGCFLLFGGLPSAARRARFCVRATGRQQ